MKILLPLTLIRIRVKHIWIKRDPPVSRKVSNTSRTLWPSRVHDLLDSEDFKIKQSALRVRDTSTQRI